MEYLTINSKDKHKTVSQLSQNSRFNLVQLRSTKLSATRPKDDRNNLPPQGQWVSPPSSRYGVFGILRKDHKPSRRRASISQILPFHKV